MNPLIIPEGLARVFGLACIVGSTAICDLAYAQSDPLLGTWILNVAQSTFPAGEALRSRTMTFRRSEGNLTNTSETVDEQGRQRRVVLMHIYDGRPHPMTGALDSDSAAYTRIDANTVIFSRTKQGKLTTIGSLLISADGKKLTVSGIGAAGTGQSGTYVFIFDKQ